MPDYLPRPDNAFNRWVADFTAYSMKHRAELGLAENEIAELQKARSAWDEAFARHQSAQETAREATGAKEDKRAAVEQAVRKYVRVIQARPATTNRQRRELGITVKPDVSYDGLPGTLARPDQGAGSPTQSTGPDNREYQPGY